MFSITEAVKYGWEKFKANLELSLLATLLTVAIGFIGDQGHWSVALLFAILSIIVRIGYTKIFLRMNDGETPKFKDIFEEYPLFWKYLITSILQGLAILGGLLLLIIPGIIFAIKYSFAPLILIDTKTDPIGSMKESAVLTKDKKWQLLGFYLVLGLLNIAGFSWAFSLHTG
jgi:uncharacterized membrane protein